MFWTAPMVQIVELQLPKQDCVTFFVPVPQVAEQSDSVFVTFQYDGVPGVELHKIRVSKQNKTELTDCAILQVSLNRTICTS